MIWTIATLAFALLWCVFAMLWGVGVVLRGDYGKAARQATKSTLLFGVMATAYFGAVLLLARL